MGACHNKGSATYITKGRNALKSTEPVMPELEGTQKQVDWANDLRKTYVLEFENAENAEKIQGRSTQTGEIYYNPMTNERKEKLNAINELKTATVDILTDINQASEIIDLRNSITSSTIGKTANTLVKQKQVLNKLTKEQRKKAVHNIAAMSLFGTIKNKKIKTYSREEMGL